MLKKIMKIKPSAIEKSIIHLLIYMIPFHYVICEVILKNFKWDNLIRDFLIVFAYCLHILRNGLKTNKLGLFIYLADVLCVIFAMVSLLFFHYPATLNVLRTYVIPSLIYFIVQKEQCEKEDYIKMTKFFCIEIAVIGVLGFLQAFILGDQFLIDLGYPVGSDGLLAGTFYINGFFRKQRSVGTFASANTFGVIICIAIFVVAFLTIGRRTKKQIWLLGLLVVGLVATLSRSAILGFVLAVLLLFFLTHKVKKRNMHRFFRWTIMVVITGMLVDNFLLNGLFSAMLKSSIVSALTFSDLSAKKHLEDVYVPIQTIIKYPLGLGFGNNGPIALNSGNFGNHVESSIYTIMYEFGFFVSILYFAHYIKFMIDSFLSHNTKKCAAGAIILTVFITYIFLPNIQSFEVLFYVYMVMGYASNGSIIDLFKYSKIEKEQYEDSICDEC